ncbi:MAG: hypothetical protein AAFR27_12250, partial [Pseudomonadota bacterium]
MYMDGEMDDDASGPEKARVWGLNVGAEHQFSEKGLSIFARYGYMEYFQDEGSSGDNIAESTYSLGFKWRFGAGSSSLKAGDMDGAISNLPNFARIVAQTGGPLE